MDELIEVINHMNEVISGIESISRQTNLLALNASISDIVLLISSLTAASEVTA